MKQIEVTILGQSYVLGAPDGGEDALLAAVRQVDREMTAIRQAGKVKARERIAVLAALNLAYALAQRDDLAAGVPVAGLEAAATSHDEVDALIRRLDAVLAEDVQLI